MYEKGLNLSPIKSILISGGGKKSLGWRNMFKAFWLSLVDPSNIDGLKDEAKREKPGKMKSGGLFGSKKKVGKSLK